MRHTPTLSIAVRRGFTLVELLVAAALCVLVMYVLAEAFKAGTDTLSQLKSVAGLADQLRIAETILRSDLKHQHLEDERGNPVLVSDLGGPNGQTFPWAGPKRGFFKISQQTKPSQRVHSSITTYPYDSTSTSSYLWEGRDPNQADSFHATDQWLQFTCRLSGKTNQDVYYAAAPGPGTPNTIMTTPSSGLPSLTRITTPPIEGLALSPANLTDYDTTRSQFVSRWGEITYWLAQPDPTAKTPPEAGTPQQPLYALYRRARVVVPLGSSASDLSVAASTNANDPYGVVTSTTNFQTKFPDLSSVPVPATNTNTSWKLVTPDEITVPVAQSVPHLNVRLGPATNPYPYQKPPAPIPSTDAPNYGSDIVLANVVSMRVQVMDGRTGVPTTTTPTSVALALQNTTNPLHYVDPFTLAVSWDETAKTFAPPSTTTVAANDPSLQRAWPMVWDTNPTPNPDLPTNPPRTAQKPARIRGIRIELRVYDAKNMVTRQITIDQPL